MTEAVGGNLVTGKIDLRESATLRVAGSGSIARLGSVRNNREVIVEENGYVEAAQILSFADGSRASVNRSLAIASGGKLKLGEPSMTVDADEGILVPARVRTIVAGEIAANLVVEGGLGIDASHGFQNRLIGNAFVASGGLIAVDFPDTDVIAVEVQGDLAGCCRTG
ncbi:MAG: hypothetical protein AAF561_14315 [Planctomycetota bacterium]